MSVGLQHFAKSELATKKQKKKKQKIRKRKNKGIGGTSKPEDHMLATSSGGGDPMIPPRDYHCDVCDLSGIKHKLG